MSKLADILPPKARNTIYVVGAFLAIAVTVVYSAIKDGFQVDDIPLIVTGLLSAGGFGMASANTPK